MKVHAGLLLAAALLSVVRSQSYDYQPPPPQNGGGGGGGGGSSYNNGGGGGGGGSGGGGGPSAPAQYNFQYDVSDAASGNNFGHSESREGSRTDGRYYVQLPDSRLMTVEYYADETGYHPTITFEGEAQFPEDQGGASNNNQYQQPRAQQPSNQYQQPPSQPSPPSQQYGQPGFGK